MASGSGGPTIAKAYVAIIPTTKDAQKNISKALVPEMNAASEEAGEKGGNTIVSSLGSALKKGAKIVATAATAAAASGIAALNAFTYKAVDAYSEFEQLSGGVEKIFDEMDTTRIFSDAQNAYKELGMSANAYLESMTSIGATFASTLGDEKGYEVARRGMGAISDLASGTGKDLDTLTEKYQLITRSSSSYLSIADQFAGILPQTTAGFLEAAQSAGLLSSEYQELKDVPLPEYQEAVTAMIESGVGAMGLLGNTAREAEQTLSGSAQMMKASWENLLTAFGTGSGEQVQQAVDNALDATITWGKLMYDRIQVVRRAILEALPGIWNSIMERAPEVIDYIRGVLRSKLEHASEIGQTILEKIKPIAEKIASTLGEAVKTLLPKLGPLVRNAISFILSAIKSIDWIELGQSIIDFLLSIDWVGIAQDIVDTFGAAFSALMDKALESSIGQSIAGALQEVITFISPYIPVIIEFIQTTLMTAFNAVRDALQVVGPMLVDIAGKIIEFLSSINWSMILEFLGFIVDRVMSIASSIGSILLDVITGVLWPLIQNVWNFLSTVFFPGLLEFIGPVMEAIGIVIDMAAAIFDWIAQLTSAVVDVLQPAIDILFAFLNPLIERVMDALATLAGNIISSVGVIWDHVKPFIDKVVEIVSSVFSAIGTWIEDNKGWLMALFGFIGELIGNFVSLIATALGTAVEVLSGVIGFIIDLVTGLVDGIWKEIQGLIGIFTGIFDFIVGLVTGDFDKMLGGAKEIVDGIGKVFEGVIDLISAPFKAAFNAIKKLWNDTLGGLSIDIPDWVPGVGGQSFGIPKLAEGGTLNSSGTVLVGEAGPELLTLPAGASVTPLDGSAATGDTYNVQVGEVSLSDDDEVKRVTRDYLEKLALIANARRVVLA